MSDSEGKPIEFTKPGSSMIFPHPTKPIARVLSYGDGLDSHPEEAALIGQIITFWNVIEHHCALLMASFMRCSNHLSEQLLYSIASSKARMNVVESVLFETVCSVRDDNIRLDLSNEIRDLMKDVVRFLDARNAIAHGMYAIENDKLKRIRVRDGWFAEKGVSTITTKGLQIQYDQGKSLTERIQRLTSKGDALHAPAQQPQL